MKKSEFTQKLKTQLTEGAKDDVIGILRFLYNSQGGIDYSRGSKFINMAGKNYSPEEFYKIYKQQR